MNKQDRAMIALNNKLQLKMMLAAMKNASRKQDKKTLIDAFENKLEEIEGEITSSNELLEQLPKDRIAKRKVLTSLTDRLDKVSEYNYIEENGQYFKLKRQTPRSILFADEDIKSAGGLDQPLFKEPRGGVPTDFKTVQVELDDLKIPIEKEVYDAAMFENVEIKKLIAKEQQSYRDIVKKETELIDKYVTNKKSVDLKFKADILKEQLANDDIYLDLYIKDKDNYDGLVYSENLKAYTPIKYDRYLESQQLSDQVGMGEYGAFRFDVSSQRKKIDDLTKGLQKDKFTIKPSASFTDAKVTGIGFELVVFTINPEAIKASK